MQHTLATIFVGSAAAQTFSGSATTYGPPGGVAVFGGNCGLMDSLPFAAAFHAALNTAQYGQGVHCGRCIQVQCVGPRCKSHAKIIGQITDRCPECLYGGLDLTLPFFEQVTGDRTDSYPISWQFVDCPVTGGVKVCAKSGSSPWWLAVQPTNTVGGVQSMQINGKPAALTAPVINNYYFKTAQPTTDIPLDKTLVELTAFTGETIHATVALRANECTQLPVQFQTRPPSPPPVCSTHEDGIDYYGNDIGNLPLVPPNAQLQRVHSGWKRVLP
ncbi:hypothetical protein ACHHYP_07017 [Achlya hypogyna]|uniref:Expansin-like EG45 domain-containing protein n=1 Tax=Achlya hypogyna TaxID=1202772 RepID=A0A1V9YRA6_ACHHY|nr:hypothetical protein ACHHYP_07017 [Achlya hypogyna]